MSDNDFPSSDAIRKAEDQGLVFSEDKKTLKKCINKEIAEVVIPDSVTEIGYGAFYGCSSLTSVVIPNSVTEIGWRAFAGVQQVNSNNSKFKVCKAGGLVDVDHQILLYIPPCTTEYVLPDSVTKIGYGAFQGCTSLTSVVIPNSVTKIGGWAFYDCSSLTSVVLPDSVTEIGDGAFRNCESLTSVVIPNSVTKIGSGAFYKCTSLTSVVIPDSVTKIGWTAFWGCTSLTSVVIPDQTRLSAFGCVKIFIPWHYLLKSLVGIFFLRILCLFWRKSPFG